jgi:predicted alpha-1,6-mannanase (GH76 family)
LIDGVEFSEKVRTLRAKYAYKAEVLQPLETKLVELHSLNINDASLDWRTYLAEVNNTLNEVSKKLAE